VSAEEGGVVRTANAPVSGAGDAADDEVGEAATELVALGEALAWEPWPPHPATRKANATSDAGCFTAGIIYLNGNVRTWLRFRYDPASEAGTDPSPPGHRSKGYGLTDGTCCPFCFICLEEY
jgi:hypothetical protein